LLTIQIQISPRTLIKNSDICWPLQIDYYSAFFTVSIALFNKWCKTRCRVVIYDILFRAHQAFQFVLVSTVVNTIQNRNHGFKPVLILHCCRLRGRAGGLSGASCYNISESENENKKCESMVLVISVLMCL
jgi:hypothetical protein